MSERDQFDPVREWLGAYLDGELTDERRGWVEDHLASCSTCQRELEEMRALSVLLHSDPEPRPSMAEDAFTAALFRQLNGRASSGWKGGARSLLRYAPVGLLGIWAFFQAVIWVAGGLLLGLNFVPGSQQALAWLAPLAGNANQGYLATWINSALMGANLSGSVKTAAEVAQWSWFGPLTLISLVSSMLIAGLFLAWMAGLWIARRAELSAVYQENR